MTGNATKFGRAFVELYADVHELHQNLRESEMTIRQWIQRIGLAAAGLGATLLAGFLPAVNAAARRMETMNAFRMVFMGANEEANRLVETLSNRLKRSEPAIARAMTGIGAMVRGLGLGAEEAARFAAQVAQAGLDIASFYNENEEATFQRLRSALSGSSEAVDQFGINLRAQALKMKLAEMGYEANIQKATELQKTLARMAIIQEALIRQNAAGDLERTASSYANMARSLKDVISETLGNLGDAVLPMAQKVQAVFVSLVKWVGDFAKQHPRVIQGIAAMGTAAVIMGVSAWAAIAALNVFTSVIFSLPMRIFSVVAALRYLVGTFGLLAYAAPVATVAIQGVTLAFSGLQKVLAFLGATPVLTFLMSAFSSLASIGSVVATTFTSIGSALAAWFWPVTAAVAALAALWYGLKKLNDATGLFNDMFRMFGEAWQNVKQSFAEMWRLASRLEEPLQRLANTLRRLWREEMARFNSLVQRLGESLKPLADLIGGALLRATEIWLEAVISAVETLEKALIAMGIISEELSKPEFQREGKPIGGGNAQQPMPGDEKYLQQLAGFAQQFIEQTLTPLERFNQTVLRAQAALHAGMLTQEQYNRVIGQARERYRQDTENPRLKAMIDAGRQLTERHMTSQERYNAEMRRLTIMLRAGFITQETYRRAVAEQQQRLVQEQQRAQEQKQREMDAARREQKADIDQRTNLEIKAARAAGDDKAELRAIFKRYAELAAAGFVEEAIATRIEGLGKIVSNADAVINEAAQMQDNAAFVTGGANAAASLGANAIDQELLDQAKLQRGLQERATTELERIRRRLDE